jgi:hypothetical protein
MIRARGGWNETTTDRHRYARFWGPHQQRQSVRAVFECFEEYNFMNTQNTMALISSSAEEILQYVSNQFDEVLLEETRIKRNPKFEDKRVHALIYFVQPTGHGYVISCCVVFCC